jgi:hypothetical protein
MRNQRSLHAWHAGCIGHIAWSHAGLAHAAIPARKWEELKGKQQQQQEGSVMFLLLYDLHGCP